MDAQTVGHLLGRPSDDSDVEAALVRFGIRRRPKLTFDNEDLDGPIQDPRDWVINSSRGIEFGFEDESSFRGDDPICWGHEGLILSQIYFYGYHNNVRPYGSPMPFGLTVNDDRPTVTAKLGAVRSAPRRYTRDVWELPDFRLTVSYTDSEKSIDFALFWLRRPSLPSLESPKALPGIDAMIDRFGADIADSALSATFGGLRFDDRIEDRDAYLLVDYTREYGFELKFHYGAGLSQIVMYRERELNARGWTGELPKGLRFNDSPEVMFQKVHQPPEVHVDDTFEGHALWDFGSYGMTVHYSTMRNYILSVEILSPEAFKAVASGK